MIKKHFSHLIKKNKKVIYCQGKVNIKDGKYIQGMTVGNWNFLALCRSVLDERNALPLGVKIPLERIKEALVHVKVVLSAYGLRCETTRWWTKSVKTMTKFRELFLSRQIVVKGIVARFVKRRLWPCGPYLLEEGKSLLPLSWHQPFKFLITRKFLPCWQ